MPHFVNVECVECHEIFEIQYRYRNKQKFCSRECAYKNKIKPRIIQICEWCNNEFMSKITDKRKFCSQGCAQKAFVGYKMSDESKMKMSVKAKGRVPWNKGKVAKDDGRILNGDRNPAFGKTYKTKENNPEWATKISETLKERKVNVGDKNGMKKPEARKKVSETRKRMFEEHPEMKEKLSEITKKQWIDGIHDETATGKCKWYDYIKKDGSTIKCQGTWEVAFAKWADDSGLKFTTHKGRVYYFDAKNKKHHYMPDFFIEDWGSYVDIKCDYIMELQKEKFEYIFKSNPGLNLKILNKETLIDLGVII